MSGVEESVYRVWIEVVRSPVGWSEGLKDQGLPISSTAKSLLFFFQ